MAQNPCALCGEHESLPNQEACAICANDSEYAEEQMGSVCADLDEIEADWDEEHRRAAESGELFEGQRYGYE